MSENHGVKGRRWTDYLLITERNGVFGIEMPLLHFNKGLNWAQTNKAKSTSLTSDETQRRTPDSPGRGPAAGSPLSVATETRSDSFRLGNRLHYVSITEVKQKGRGTLLR